MILNSIWWWDSSSGDLICVQKSFIAFIPRATLTQCYLIRVVLKKYQDWSCIYQERNEQWMKRWFSSKYELCWKSIRTEAVFTKTEINNEWNVNFLPTTKSLIPESFSLVEAPQQSAKMWIFSVVFLMMAFKFRYVCFFFLVSIY